MSGLIASEQSKSTNQYNSNLLFANDRKLPEQGHASSFYSRKDGTQGGMSGMRPSKKLTSANHQDIH